MSRKRTDFGLTATVRNAVAGALVRIRLNVTAPSGTDPALRLRALTLSLSDDGRAGGGVFNVSVASPARKADRPAVPQSDVVGYVNITSDLTESAVSDATIEFAVPTEALPEGSGPESVRLYRFDAPTGEWVPAGATYDADRGTYQASIGTLSPLAIVTTGAGSVEVLTAGGLPDWTRRGTTTSVTAEVANPGEANASRVLTVAVDGDPVAEQRVTLGPGERTNVSLEFEARTGTVTVEGVEAGELQSSDEYGETTADTPADTEQGDFPITLGLLFLAVVGILAGVVSVYRVMT